MPTPGWLRRQDLPVDAAGRSYIDPANLDQILDEFVNWRGNVNGGGYTLSNVVLAANVTGVQTPWASNIDAAGHNLANLGSMSMSGDIIANGRFGTAVGTLIIYRQNSTNEGGEIQLQNPHDNDTLAIDNVLSGSVPHMRLFHKTNNKVWLDIDMSNGSAQFGGMIEIPGGKSFASNLHYDGTNWRYIVNGSALAISSGAGSTIFYNAPSGTAGAVATLTSRLSINDDATIAIATGRFDVIADLALTGNLYARAFPGGGGEGGKIRMMDSDNVGSWTFDNDATHNVRFYRTGTSTVIFALMDGGAIRMYLGGSTKTLSVDGSGFVKAT
jgi:hypothetical protein